MNMFLWWVVGVAILAVVGYCLCLYSKQGGTINCFPTSNNTDGNVDNVNQPKHYTQGGIECIDVMLRTQGINAVMSFCICNAFKYIYRHLNKNGIEDIKKAQWYINKYIELYEEKQEQEEH